VRKITKLRPKRRRRLRLRYLINAWAVSLVVHGAVLCALAFASFSAADVVRRIINFDSALTTNQSGEPELVPIYSDPADIPRDEPTGGKQAPRGGAGAKVVPPEGGSDGDDAGAIGGGGMGSGRPTATPRVRGVGKGRINEGASLPGVKLDGVN